MFNQNLIGTFFSVLDLSEKLSALEYDLGDLRKGEEVHRVRGEMQRHVGGLVESLGQVEESMTSLEREVITEVNRTEHKVSYLEATIRKDMQEMKNSIREGMSQGVKNVYKTGFLWSLEPEMLTN